MENLFTQFSGADLDRLVECICAVRTAGLQVDKHTHAGVNQNSGNVWICSEDWAGCVACSVGFNVSWYHSCPECGEEYAFDTYSELGDYARAHDGQCEACKPVEPVTDEDRSAGPRK